MFNGKIKWGQRKMAFDTRHKATSAPRHTRLTTHIHGSAQASAHFGAAYKMSTKCRRFTCPSESGSHVVFTFSKISAGTPSPRFPNRCLDGNDKGKENERRLMRTMSTACER
jgi:hypothetical protein